MTTLMMVLGFAFGWCEMTGHVGWANGVALVMMAFWAWNFAKRLDEEDRKGMHANERCDH